MHVHRQDCSKHQFPPQNTKLLKSGSIVKNAPSHLLLDCECKEQLNLWVLNGELSHYPAIGHCIVKWKINLKSSHSLRWFQEEVCPSITILNNAETKRIKHSSFIPEFSSFYRTRLHLITFARRAIKPSLWKRSLENDIKQLPQEQHEFRTAGIIVWIHDRGKPFSPSSKCWLLIKQSVFPFFLHRSANDSLPKLLIC